MLAGLDSYFRDSVDLGCVGQLNEACIRLFGLRDSFNNCVFLGDSITLRIDCTW